MEELSGHQSIYSGKRTSIDLAFSRLGKKFVVKKRSSNSGQNGLVNEFKVASSVYKDYSFFDTNNGEDVYVRPYYEGSSLKDFLQKNEIGVKDFLQIAINLCQELQKFHNTGRIDTGLNSYNIVINPITLSLAIIDLEHVFRLEDLRKGLVPQLGSVDYCSPELKEEKWSSISYGSDYFALGSIFYELLTRRLPFDDHDKPLIRASEESVFFENVDRQRKDLPLVVKDVVIKLIKPSPEERYRSLESLEYDLITILSQMEKMGRADRFELDQVTNLRVTSMPQNIVGRDLELAEIHDFHSRLNEKTKLLLNVEGEAGTGKTFLIKSAINGLPKDNGVLLKASFHFVNQQKPYTAWEQVLNGLIDYFLSQDSKGFKKWSDRLIEGLGDLGTVLLEICPRFRIIFKGDNQLDRLEGNERLNRLHYVFVKLFRIISEVSSGPLVVVFDNYHNRDSASEELLVYLLRDVSIRNVMFVCVYQNSFEWDEDRFKNNMFYGFFIKSIQLFNLNKPDYKTLVSTVFNDRLVRFDEFCDFSFQIIKGNPAYLGHFLRQAVAKDLLTLNRSDLNWNWTLECFDPAISGVSLQDIIRERFLFESERIREFLIRFNAFGGGVERTKFINTFPEFKDYFNEVIPMLIENDLIIEETSYVNGHITHKERFFLKDEITAKVILKEVEPDKQKELHKIIARGLNRIAKPDVPYDVFDVTRHFSECKDLFRIDNECEIVFIKYLQAAEIARDGAAFKIANYYLNEARACFDEKWWQSNYNLGFRFFIVKLEVEAALFLNDEFDQSKEVVLSKDIGKVEKLKVYNLCIEYYRNISNYDQAIAVAIEAVALFGITLKKEYSQTELLKYYAYLILILRRKEAQFFRNQSFESEGEYFELTRIFSKIATTVYFGAPSMLPVILTHVAKVAINHCNTEFTIKGLIGYSTVLASELKDFKNGSKFREISLELVDKYKIRSASEVYFLSTFSRHWEEHLSKSLTGYFKGYEQGMQSGNVEYACYSLFEYCHSSFLLGYNLSNVETEFNGLKEKVVFFDEKVVMQQQEIFVDAIAVLTHKKNTWSHFKSDQNKERYVSENKTVLLFYTYLKLLLAFLFKERDSYLALVLECDKLKVASKGAYVVGYTYFIQTQALYDGIASGVIPKKNISLLKKARKKLRDYSSQCPENYLNKYQAANAFVEYLTGDKKKAKEMLDLAIETSKEYGFLHEEAMLWEIGGEMLFARGRANVAEVYLTKAFDLYKVWGANSVVNELQLAYPDFFKGTVLSEKLGVVAPSSVAIVPDSTNLEITPELKEVLSTSEDILSEIDLQPLLSKFLNAAVDWTGAKRGVVILNERDNLFIKSVLDRGTGYDSDDEDILLRDCGLLSESVVHHSCKTLQSVILYDASSDARFANDAYVYKHSCKSILAVPFVSEGMVQGVLYLEESEAVGMFTRQKLEIAKIFSNQVSITLRNVTRFKEQEEVLKSRSHELEKVNKVVLENNRLIRSSIRYALHIQNSILPTHASFSSHFDNFFIYFQPRDIVSGDFYWIGSQNGKVIVAAVDCTGHGVPGAFMSMIGNSILNNIVLENGITNPANILDELHKRVQLTLNQKETLNMDGMDASIVSIDYSTNLLEFAGANNPLFYVMGDNHFVVKGDRCAVGGVDDREFLGFQKHAVGIQKGMKVYLFSDGFQDQIGGAKNKKFMKKNFYNLLYNISKFPLTQQENLLKNTYKNWSGENDALDDVLVLGFEL